MTLDNYIKLGTSTKFEVWHHYVGNKARFNYSPACINDFPTIEQANRYIKSLDLSGTLEIIRVIITRERVC